MDDYTKDDVISSLLKIKKNSRKRVLVDQRSYLIGLLVYRFMLPEHTIAKLTGYNRNTIHHNKNIAIQFCKDKSYIQNIYVYAQMFPFNFSVIDTVRAKRKIRIELDVDQLLHNKLKAVGSILGHDDIRTTVTLLLNKSLKLWEE